MKVFLTAVALFLVASTALAGTYYHITLSSPSAKANTRAVARVSIRPSSGFKISTDSVVKLSVIAPEGVTLEKAKQKSSDATRFDATALEFDVAYTATTTGKKSFVGEVRFAVSNELETKPVVENISFVAEIK